MQIELSWIPLVIIRDLVELVRDVPFARTTNDCVHYSGITNNRENHLFIFMRPNKRYERISVQYEQSTLVIHLYVPYSQ